jgi:hypothetical protein
MPNIAAQTTAPRDNRHVQKLDEGRTATDRVWLNADGSKSLESSLTPMSYQEGPPYEKSGETFSSESPMTGVGVNRRGSGKIRHFSGFLL